MNIKKISVLGLSFAFAGMFFVLPANQVFAVPIIASALDTNASTVSVSFVGEVGVINPPTFSCFGTTANPAVASFSTLGLATFPDPSITLNNCFQQAGKYTVNIHLQDNAGNSINKGPYKYKVTAGSPDPTGGVLLVKTDCTGKQANKSDECKLELQVRDTFGNPVTQLTNADLSLLTSANAFPNDANTGDASFVAGLDLEGVVATTTATTPVSLSAVSGIFPFSLKAVSPSVQKVGTFLAQLVGRTLAFTASVANINADGTLGTTLSLPFNAPDISFQHLFSFTPRGSGFLWEGDASPGSVTLDLGFAGADQSISSRTGGIYEENPNLDYTAENIPQSIDMTNIVTHSFDTTATGTPTVPQVLKFHTDIAYQVNGQNVKYPAGGSGFDTELATLGVNQNDVIGYNAGTEVVFIGADIEGGVIGSLEKMEIQPGTETFNVSETTAKLRDQITENVFRLARGSSNIQSPGTFSSSWFADYNVAIVEVDGNVTFSGGALPSGKNTLIIKNGNFIVSSDMTYTNPEDSFGVILMNDEQVTHTKGNIFVRSTVKTMVGSYYADGGLMTNDTPTNPTVANSTNTETGNTTQLLLTGTLFSKNTLGGSMIHTELNTGEYYFPWGVTTDQTLARQYDLHYVRRYTTGDEANCAPAAGNCDTNTNAFVIRIDRKASIAPPPGFETTGNIVR